MDKNGNADGNVYEDLLRSKRRREEANDDDEYNDDVLAQQSYQNENSSNNDDTEKEKENVRDECALRWRVDEFGLERRHDFMRERSVFILVRRVDGVRNQSGLFSRRG